MEYADGGELFDYISSKKKLSELEACKFFQQIINSLEYLHMLKIVHRDLKPENLLLDGKKMIKVSDFGLSTKYSNRKNLKTACGTPSYAPPEMISGEQYNGMKSDIWSCGVILYAMLAGYLPFYESNEDIVCQKILQAQYEFPSFLSENAKDLIKKILVIDSNERFNFEQIKGHQFFNIISPTYRPGVILGVNKIPIDENILIKIKDYKLDPDNVRRCLEDNELNQLTATYYLVMRKIIKNGGNSISDLYSDAFIQYINHPNNILCEKGDISEESNLNDSDSNCTNEEIDSPSNVNDREKVVYTSSENDEKCDFLSLVKNKYEECHNNVEKKINMVSNKNKKDVKIIKIFNEKYKSTENDRKSIKERVSIKKGCESETKSRIRVNKIIKTEMKNRKKEIKLDETHKENLEIYEKKKKNYSVSPEKIYRALKVREKYTSPLNYKVLDTLKKQLIFKKVVNTTPKRSVSLANKEETSSNLKKVKKNELAICVIKEIDEYSNDEKTKTTLTDINSCRVYKVKSFKRKSGENSEVDMKISDVGGKLNRTKNPKDNALKKKNIVEKAKKILKKTTNALSNIALIKPGDYNSNKDTKSSFFSKDFKQEIKDFYESSKNTRNINSSFSIQMLLTNDINSNLINFYNNSIKQNKEICSDKKVSSTRNKDKRFIFKDEEIKTYYGIIDINCLFDISSELLLEKLISSFAKLKIAYLQTKKNKLKCTKTGMSFDFEICLLLEYKTSYLKIKRSKGEMSSFIQLTKLLLKEI